MTAGKTADSKFEPNYDEECCGKLQRERGRLHSEPFPLFRRKAWLADGSDGLSAYSDRISGEFA